MRHGIFVGKRKKARERLRGIEKHGIRDGSTDSDG